MPREKPKARAMASEEQEEPSPEPNIALSPALPASEYEQDTASEGGSEGSTDDSEALVDSLAAQILEVRAQHEAVKQAHLAGQMTLNDVKDKLRILRVDQQKIKGIDRESDPKQAAIRMLIRAEKPQSESWRVQEALQKEQAAAGKLARTRKRRMTEVAAGNFARAEQLVQTEQRLKQELASNNVERLKIVLADEQQMLKGEQLNQQREELKRQVGELSTAEQFGAAHRVQQQIEEVTAQLDAISHSLRAHHLVDHTRPKLGRGWHHTPPPAAAKGANFTGQRKQGKQPPRDTDVGSAGRYRPWHMSGGREPSPDQGARAQAALLTERREKAAKAENMGTHAHSIIGMHHRGSSVWHSSAGSPGRPDEHPTAEQLSPTSWSTSALVIGTARD